MKTRIFLTVIFAMYTCFVFSQHGKQVNTVIKGQLTDSLTSETVPYATIKIATKENPTVPIKAVATDENGKFQFSMDKKGEFLFIAEYIGKKSLSNPIILGESKTLDLGIVKMSDNAQSLTEVVVSAQKPLVKVDLDKITYSLEDDPEAKTNNVLEMLRKVPMVTVDGEENIKLKGSSNFKIYLNGKPSNMISSNPKDVLRSMPANTIKDIEIITDPGAKYDAEGVAGIINIITQKNSSMGGYTASVNGRTDSRGGFGGGGYLSMKYGKFGFTGRYNYYDYKQPKGEYSSFTENLKDNDNKYSRQSGFSKNKGNGQFGSGELSYEIDTLNLINVGFNRYEGNNTARSIDQLVEMQDINNVTQYSYEKNGKSKGKYGGTDVNVDYQRTFNKKDQLLTASYRFSYSPNDSESDTWITPIVMPIGDGAVTNHQFSDADMKEHTFQIDFVTPFNKVHSLEAGAKYIIRLNESESGYKFLNITDEWISKTTDMDRFKHQQDILAAYGGYSAKLKKWGFKTGVRYEATWLDAKYPINTGMNFKVDYSNIVPSATVTYQLKPMQNLRFGYNMRISRPGIWQLNPYVNSTDPSYIQQGNPKLDAVKNHNISANYGFFNPTLNFNLNLAYSFENNGVETVTNMVDGIRYSSYDNIAERKNLGLSAYVNWSPNDKVRIYSNLSGGYTDIQTNNDRNLSNNGFTANIYGGGEYKFPASFRAYLNAGYFSPYLSLENKSSSFFFHSFSVSKGFKNDRLMISAYASNPFTKEWKFKNKTNSDLFRSETIMTQNTRQFGISFSFRFGEMKAQIKKAQRSISNDDVMSGGQNQSGQSGGQGGM
ncbi:MAG: TonB-dependent receptor [Dysgonomonas sp.]|nr:TonB-dependent receptor [Dysgonomonas sp.]